MSIELVKGSEMIRHNSIKQMFTISSIGDAAQINQSIDYTITLNFPSFSINVENVNTYEMYNISTCFPIQIPSMRTFQHDIIKRPFETTNKIIEKKEEAIHQGALSTIKTGCLCMS